MVEENWLIYVYIKIDVYMFLSKRSEFLHKSIKA